MAPGVPTSRKDSPMDVSISRALLLQIVGRLTADETFLGWVRGRARRHALTLSLQDLLEERGRAEAALDLVTATRRYWEDDASVRVDDLARQQIDREGIWLSGWLRSEEHTSELQSLMRISYAVSCWKKKKKSQPHKQ